MSQEQDRPLGKPFTHVYRDRRALASDSPRFRVQLEAILRRTLGPAGYSGPRASELVTFLAVSAGIEIEVIGGYTDTYYCFDRFVADCRTDDVLDFITYTAHYLSERGGARPLKTWTEQVQRAFDVQNLAYEIDEQGGVHHRIDAAYVNTKASTLKYLSDAKFDGAHGDLERAFNFLTAIPPDNKMAVVNAFLAVESVFKIAVDNGSGLAKDTVGKRLAPLVQKLYSDADNATRRSTGRFVESFACWANACHAYRHGEKDEDVVAPPDEIAVSLVTTGADFIRWLVELSRKTPPARKAEPPSGDTLDASATAELASSMAEPAKGQDETY